MFLFSDVGIWYQKVQGIGKTVRNRNLRLHSTQSNIGKNFKLNT